MVQEEQRDDDQSINIVQTIFKIKKKKIKNKMSIFGPTRVEVC